MIYLSSPSNNRYLFWIILKIIDFNDIIDIKKNILIKIVWIKILYMIYIGFISHSGDIDGENYTAL